MIVHLASVLSTETLRLEFLHTQYVMVNREREGRGGMEGEGRERRGREREGEREGREREKGRYM